MLWVYCTIQYDINRQYFMFILRHEMDLLNLVYFRDLQ